MALKLRRGTNSGRTAITPAEGEPIYTTDTKELYVGDGTTAGGIKITGGVTDGDKGDITVSSSGATWTVDNDAVTYAKIQNVSATSRLLGRASSGAGDIEEITIGTGLTLTGTTLSAGGGGGALGAPTAVVNKTADETVTNSDTLQADDHLTYAFTANKSYYIEFRLLVSRTNTTDSPMIKLAFDGSSKGYISTRIADGVANLDNNVSTLGGIPRVIKVEASLLPTSNITSSLLWAQVDISSNTGITVHKGSQMFIWEVA